MPQEANTQRSAPRHELLLKVEYPPALELAPDYANNLSSGGVFICTAEPFPVGRGLNFTLSFPGVIDPIELTGVVRWRRPPMSGSTLLRAGIGLEFVFRDKKHQAQLQHVIQQLRGARLNHEAEGDFRVLIADDSSVVLKLFSYTVKKMEQELKAEGTLRVTTATDGKDAWEHLVDGVDMVILDHYLPVITGCEIVRRARSAQVDKRVPILVVSGGGPDIRQEALAAGADFFLAKPVVITELMNGLRTVLQQVE